MKRSLPAVFAVTAFIILTAMTALTSCSSGSSAPDNSKAETTAAVSSSPESSVMSSSAESSESSAALQEISLAPVAMDLADVSLAQVTVDDEFVLVSDINYYYDDESSEIGISIPWEDLKPLAEEVIRQYEAARVLDPKAYYKTMGIRELMEREEFSTLPVYTGSEKYEENEVFDYILTRYFWDTVYDYAEEDHEEQLLAAADSFNATVRATDNALRELDEQKLEKILTEKDSIYPDFLEYDEDDAVLPKSFFSDREKFVLKDGLVLDMIIYGAERINGVLYAHFNMSVYKDGYRYDFKDVTAWSCGDGHGVKAGGIFVARSLMSGMTREDILKELRPEEDSSLAEGEEGSDLNGQ
ncbi:MAG: hypothetical protein IJ806_01650 [Ruminococcus sp.]|nr:hypothetical protein [Ruminococcus sp.]